MMRALNPRRLAIEELLLRASRLSRRARSLRTLAAFSAVAGVIAPGIVFAAVHDLAAAAAAAAPLLVALLAVGWAFVTRAEARKVRLLLFVLDRDRDEPDNVRGRDEVREAGDPAPAL
jgi:hypothetical protein